MTCNNICILYIYIYIYIYIYYEYIYIYIYIYIYYEYIYIYMYIYARNRISALGFPSPLSMWIQLCHSMRVFFTHMLKTAPRSALSTSEDWWKC